MTVADCFEALSDAGVTRAHLIEYQGRGLLVCRVKPWQRKRADMVLNDPAFKAVSIVVRIKWLAPWWWLFGVAYKCTPVLLESQL